MTPVELNSDIGLYLRATGNGLILISMIVVLAVCSLVWDEPFLSF